MMQGGNCNGTYSIHGWVRNSSAARTAVRTSDVIWHGRLGHADIYSIDRLFRSGAVLGFGRVTPSQFQDCSGFFEGKQSRERLHMNNFRARFAGDVIHSDVCGPMSSESLGGSRYFVSFLDEYCWNCWN